MLYTICIGLILVACVLVILAILVQSPKSGMAANFGASNQVMGVRQTSDFLEKFTWTMAIAILALSLLATIVMDGSAVSRSNSELNRDAEIMMQMQSEQATPAIPQAEIPAEVEAGSQIEAEATAE
ncbi:MAG: preprotein translocase subunit SecG [Rikenellaceae bacterium]